MNIKGKIKWVSETSSFQTRDNRTMLKKEAVIETEEQYPQSLMFEITGELVKNVETLMPGQKAEVDYNVHATEYKGRYYNHARAWKIVLVQQ